MWFRHSWTYHGCPAPTRLRTEINDRQEKVDGHALAPWQEAHVVAIGAGGINMTILYGMAMKGVRRLSIYDDDEVELSNLPRQLFALSEVGQNKAHAAGKHLSRRALFPFTAKTYPFRFQERFSIDQPPKQAPHFFLCGVDNNPTKRALAAYASKFGIPVIFASLSRDANACSVFVQQPGQACWGCVHPQFLNSNEYPCGLPGILDIINVAAGVALHAADSLLCDRPRHWNYRELFLDGGLPDRNATIEPRDDCPICSLNTAQTSTSCGAGEVEASQVQHGC